MRWPQIRAGLIALAIVLGMIDGCPLPSPSHTPEWERGFVEPIRSIRAVVLRPVQWLGDTFAVTQRFSLYQAPIAQRFRMWVETRSTNQDFVVRYRAGDAQYTADADVIEHARVWSEWDPREYPPFEYKAWVTWIATRWFDRDPEIQQVRVRMERIEIGQGEVTPTGAFVFGEVRHRWMVKK
ncbi:MAG: hypothetical protein QM831_35390 [Kofleriaceae bacterium]